MTDWQTKNIYFQMGNIGSEIGRALKWKKIDSKKAQNASDRALELIDWTLSDQKNKKYLKEIARIRELFLDLFLGDNQYHQTAESWDRYFYPYSLVANQKS